MLVLLGLLGGGAGYLASCKKSDAAAVEPDEDNHPLLKKAKRKLQTQETDEAIELYTRLIEEHPRMARAHLELALVYDEHEENFIRAIYHYNRFLELQPETEKRELIDDAIRHARMSFAASLPNRPSEAVNEIAELNREIKRLREQNVALTKMLHARQDPSAAAPAGRGASAVHARPQAAPAAPAPPPVPAGPAEYTVQRGDTLMKIAYKMYQDSNRWEEIYDANRSRLSNQRDLRIGQELTIPR